MHLIALTAIILALFSPPVFAKDSVPKTPGKRTPSESWGLLGHDGTCAPIRSLKFKFPTLPTINTPTELVAFLKAHQGHPKLYPIDDPTQPNLKGYSLFDADLQLSIMLMPTKQCDGKFGPKDMVPETPSQTTP
jgi:hypothetical protein